ncbi:MAG: SecDF P1 head subdomain-containing protein [Acidimicrobiia bacterium]
MGRQRTRRFAAICTIVLLAACESGGSAAHDSSSSDEKVTIEVADTSNLSSAQLERTAQIVQQRLRALGVPNAEVRVRGPKLVAAGSGVAAVAPRTLQRGVLEFRPVLELLTPMSTPANGGTVLPNRPGNDANVRYSVGEAELTGHDVRSASATDLGDSQGWVVNLRLTDAGATKFNQLARALYPNQLPQNEVAIVLDGVVQSAPRFMTDRFSGDIQISGQFTQAQAKDLGVVIDSGALPVKLQLAPTG